MSRDARFGSPRHSSPGRARRDVLRPHGALLNHQTIVDITTRITLMTTACLVPRVFAISVASEDDHYSAPRSINFRSSSAHCSVCQPSSKRRPNINSPSFRICASAPALIVEEQFAR